MFATCLILFCSVTLFTAKCQDGSVENYENLIKNFLKQSAEWKHPSDNRKFFQASNDEPIQYANFDFIIVGAGAGGSVLTNRLSESGKFTVLLLEAGGQETDFTEIPGFAALLANSDYNWGYKSVPQTTACLGFKNKQCNYPRGKLMGGSTSINFMMYVRGNKEDFKIWGKDNPGWDYEGVLPYFKKSENSTVRLEDYDYHGHDGLLSVENVQHSSQITEIFLEAMLQRGLNILDYNGENEIGCSKVQCMTDRGKRCSGNKAFIKPALHRRNLQVLDESLVIKVLIKNKKAYGVEFIRDGKKYQVTASKEVILSAGTHNSAQLLMLSGIGPKEHLEEVGVPLVQDLPVGKFLNDHQMFNCLLFATNLTVEPTPLTELLESYIKGDGALTEPAGITALAFTSPRIKSNNPSTEYMLFAGWPEQMAPFFIDFIGMTDENWQPWLKPIIGKYCWGIIPILFHPKSSGTVKLKSNDPLDFPLIDPNLYTDSENDDMEEMLSIIRDVFEISKTPAFQSVDSRYLSEPFPACTDFEFHSDDYWKCALRQITYPILHAVSTCKMGPESDQTAVVSSRLKVHGVDSLRVADASVIPFSISSHPTASVYMIGEKAADFIRGDYGDL